jgi:hypothetical protein
MPRYDYLGSCGLRFDLSVPYDEHQNVVACLCGSKKCKAEWHWLPEHSRSFNQQLPGVVYFKDAKGNIQVASSSEEPAPPGMERCEAYTLNEIRRLEKHLNADQRRIRQQFIEREQAHQEAVIAENRRELRTYMEQFSEQGRQFARDMMRRNDTRKSIYDKKVDPGVHLHILHYDGGKRR